MVTLVEDPMEMVVATRAGDQMAMGTVTPPMAMEMVIPVGMAMEMVIPPVGMGFQDRTRCLGFELFSGRVLELLEKYCEDYEK